MTKESQQQEADLKEAGWRPFAVHPNSSIWYSPASFEPDEKPKPYPGPGYAWRLMTEAKLKKSK